MIAGISAGSVSSTARTSAMARISASVMPGWSHAVREGATCGGPWPGSRLAVLQGRGSVRVLDRRCVRRGARQPDQRPTPTLPARPNRALTRAAGDSLWLSAERRISIFARDFVTLRTSLSQRALRRSRMSGRWMIVMLLAALVFSRAAIAQDAFPRVLRFPAGKSPGSIAIADFDADAVLDLATADKFGGGDVIGILLGNGD